MRPGRAADHSFPSSAVVMEYMCVCVCVYIYIYILHDHGARRGAGFI